MQRLPRLVELLLVIALCGLIALWITRVLRGTPIGVPPTVSGAGGNANDRVDQVVASARLFGSRKPGVLSDNVRPLGVVADASGSGSVIVSIDGQPPKVYRVGDTLDGRLVSAIRPQEIELEAGGARQIFRLPPPRPATGGVNVVGSPAAMASPMPGANPDLPQSMDTPPEQRIPTSALLRQSRRAPPEDGSTAPQVAQPP
jgi:general secretion pathway protein C